MIPGGCKKNKKALINKKAEKGSNWNLSRSYPGRDTGTVLCTTRTRQIGAVQAAVGTQNRPLYRKNCLFYNIEIDITI